MLTYSERAALIEAICSIAVPGADGGRPATFRETCAERTRVLNIVKALPVAADQEKELALRSGEVVAPKKKPRGKRGAK